MDNLTESNLKKKVIKISNKKKWDESSEKDRLHTHYQAPIER